MFEHLWGQVLIGSKKFITVVQGRITDTIEMTSSPQVQYLENVTLSSGVYKEIFNLYTCGYVCACVCVCMCMCVCVCACVCVVHMCTFNSRSQLQQKILGGRGGGLTLMSTQMILPYMVHVRYNHIWWHNIFGRLNDMANN